MRSFANVVPLMPAPRVMLDAVVELSVSLLALELLVKLNCAKV
jgi:hypothetical protein